MEEIKDRILILVEKFSNGKVAAFAKLIDIPQSTLHNYTMGRAPHVENLCRIRDKFNVDLNWLITGKGEMFLHHGDKGVEVHVGMNNGSVTGENKGIIVTNSEKDKQGLRVQEKSLRAMTLLTEIMSSGDSKLIEITLSQLESIAAAAKKD